MRVLYICSGNFTGSLEHNQSFVYHQIKSLTKYGIEIDLFLIKGKGAFGYIKSLQRLKETLRAQRYDLLHGIYGLSGLLACLQRRVPVITTFIGSDITDWKMRPFSIIANLLSKYRIYVSRTLVGIPEAITCHSVIPFGVDLTVFYQEDKQKIRRKRKIALDTRIIIFSSFSRSVKNYQLARKAIDLLNYKVEVVELGKNYSSDELREIYCSSDLFLLTSISEGSPQVVKEALACGCPVISTDVGDVSKIISDLDNCYITSNDPYDIADKIGKVMLSSGVKDYSNIISRYDTNTIALKIIDIYKSLVNNDISN